MSAHTPGPWSIWNFSDDPRHVAVGPDAGGLAVADVVACNAHGCYTAETESRGQANARLIAAAPDLLVALQDLLSATEETYDNRHERQAALDAIIKATEGAA
jgi:hypothetical protein